MKYFVLYFILLFGFTSLSFAQDNPVKFLDISDGLSNNSVTTIFQDDDGYMWFGTYDGLNRYDGYNFKVFRNRINDKKSLSFNTIYNIEGDSKKNIWVGGANGISIYNKATASFHSVEYIASSKKQKTLQDIIHQMRAVSDHLVLVASQSLGLIRFENGSFIGKQIPLTALGNRIMINNYDAIAIQEDQKNNHAWVYVRNVGICSYNYSNKSLKAVFPLSKEVKAMKLASDGNLWLGTDEGLFLFNTKTGNISESYFPNKCSVTDILVDKKKEIWITTDGCGIYKVIGTNKKAIPYNSVNENQLAKSNSVWSLYEDKGGNKWFGSLRGGISMLSHTPKYFKSIRYNAKNPAENFILSFCEDEKKNVWVGTDGAGLKYWNRKTNTYINYGNKLSSPFITGIIRDNNNEIWLSTWAGGVNKINPKNNSVTQYSCYNSFTKQIEKNIWFVYQDSKNNIWAGATNEGALYLFDRAKNNFVLFDKAVNNLQCMIETSDGKLWAGNYTSLFSLEKTTRKINKIPIGNQIRYIHEDRDKNLWIGTQEGGLLLFDRKRNTFKRYTTDDGLPSNTILRLLEDKEGNLWMSTYNGICRFDKKRQTFRNFSVNDGLQSNQFSFNAGIELSTGEFLFGGINGFNIFFPEAIKGYNQKNNLLLSDFSVNNQSIEESKVEVSDSGKMKEVRLDYDQTALSLEFVAIDYNNADKINYAYFLEGWDEQWNYVGQARKANYSRLPEGKYTFKVKTTNFKGGWNKEVSLVSIEVLPPWYRTWWAYTLYLFAIAGALFVYLDYQKNKEKLKYKVKIAELESKKEKEIAEKQSSMFTYISHEFRTPLSLIINPLKKAVQKERVENGSSGSDLAIAHRNARRLLSLVDQLLLFRKAENDADSLRLSPIDVNKLCNEVYQCFVNQAKDKNISYNFQIPENEIEIIGDYEKIEISLFNLMSNAFKYTPVGGEITLRLTETSTDVAMEISDSGEGIDKADIDVIFEKFRQINSKVSISTGFGIGLFIVKYFVDKHKGKVSCSSEIGKGSIFKLTFLKGSSHFDNAVITNDVQKRTQLFDELIVDDFDENTSKANNQVSESDFQKVMLTEKRTVLIIDDNDDIRNYLIKMFSENYIVYSAENGAEGLKMTKKHMPDLVISDITMEQMDGLELCRKIKESNDLSHIPVILLTASKNPETHLQGINDGADDYITKPFDDEILVARVESLLRNRSNLRTYFLDSITLKENAQKVPVEYQEILKKCIDIVERNIHKKDFTIKTFAQEMGMSHRTLYTKIKIISGQTLNAFIRSLRIRRAAMLMLTEDMNIAQASAEVGFEDPKYFRQQFVKLFGMTPSDYIKKYKSSFNSDLNIIN